MINVASTVCGCGKTASWGFPNGRRTHCASCRQEGMTDKTKRRKIATAPVVQCATAVDVAATAYAAAAASATPTFERPMVDGGASAPIRRPVADARAPATDVSMATASTVNTSEAVAPWQRTLLREACIAYAQSVEAVPATAEQEGAAAAAAVGVQRQSEGDMVPTDGRGEYGGGDGDQDEEENVGSQMEATGTASSSSIEMMPDSLLLLVEAAATAAPAGVRDIAEGAAATAAGDVRREEGTLGVNTAPPEIPRGISSSRGGEGDETPVGVDAAGNVGAIETLKDGRGGRDKRRHSRGAGEGSTALERPEQDGPRRSLRLQEARVKETQGKTPVEQLAALNKLLAYFAPPAAKFKCHKKATATATTEEV